MKRSIENLEKNGKLETLAMTKIIGGQTDDGGFCIVDNVSGRVDEEAGGLCIVTNIPN